MLEQAKKLNDTPDQCDSELKLFRFNEQGRTIKSVLHPLLLRAVFSLFFVTILHCHIMPDLRTLYVQDNLSLKHCS